MADRYWVGGTAAWDATAGTKWALTDGGVGGQAVPTAADNVYFTSASGTVTVTVAAQQACLNLFVVSFTGSLTGTGQINASGSVLLDSTMNVGSSLTWSFRATSGSWNFYTAGKTVGPVIFGNAASTATWSLGDALTSNSAVTFTTGTFTTSNYNVTATSLSSSNSNTRTINLGSSTVTLSAATPINFATSTNLTFNAGTSSISCSTGSATFSGGGQTFNNVSFSSTAAGSHTINGTNTFNNLSVVGRTAAGVSVFSLVANQTINGTLTLSAGTNATMRTFVQSDTIGTTRTLTCAAVASLTDIDFRDITIAGAAAPVSGTRLGNCRGNSGITFGAGVTRYWNLAGSNNWSATGWAASSGASPAVNNFPLAQDTAVFEATSPGTGTTTTINAAYNIGTIDMSARTSNTMTLATGTTTPAIYGNWINGTGTTLSGSGTITFAGRGSQTITSAGKTFSQLLTINSPFGSIALQDAINANGGIPGLTITAGTFNANSYNVTTPGISSTNTNTRSIFIGSGTWTLSSSGNVWNCTTATNLTVTGTGTISLTSASAKTFTGGDIQTYPTLNQGGTGTLTVTGSNKFAGLTNTAIGRIQFTGSTTNIFTAFSISGTAGNLVQLGSTTTTQATLQKSSAWLMGANSTDGGNNTGLSFTAGGGIDYLSVSYINGTVVVPSTSYLGNFFAFF